MKKRIIATLDRVTEYLLSDGLATARRADSERMHAGGWGPRNLHAGPVRDLLAEVVALRSDIKPRPDDGEIIEPPAESDWRSETWPQRRMTRREARELGLIR